MGSNVRKVLVFRIPTREIPNKKKDKKYRYTFPAIYQQEKNRQIFLYVHSNKRNDARKYLV